MTTHAINNNRQMTRHPKAVKARLSITKSHHACTTRIAQKKTRSYRRERGRVRGGRWGQDASATVRWHTTDVWQLTQSIRRPSTSLTPSYFTGNNIEQLSTQGTHWGKTRTEYEQTTVQIKLTPTEFTPSLPRRCSNRQHLNRAATRCVWQPAQASEKNLRPYVSTVHHYHAR